jgi:hypothetical protein
MRLFQQLKLFKGKKMSEECGTKEKLHEEIFKQFISELFSLFCWHVT